MIRMVLVGELALTLALTLVGAEAHEAESHAQVRTLLMNEDFQSSGVQGIFRMGSSSIRDLIAALNDQDQIVSRNAQLMLRLIGDKQGVEALQKWYDRPGEVVRIVNGPYPVPLREWDYRQIDATLRRSSTEWREDALNYLYALAIDPSPRARKALTTMLAAAERNKGTAASQAAADLRRSLPKAGACGSGTPESFLRKHSFFVTPGERSTVNVRAFADDGHLALATVSQTFGNTFLVVLKRVDKCWRYQSAGLYSTNN